MHHGRVLRQHGVLRVMRVLRLCIKLVMEMRRLGVGRLRENYSLQTTYLLTVEVHKEHSYSEFQLIVNKVKLC